ncbi:MAG TPA: hypothetical protein VFA07_06370 [Chthonomonadaceae bacterium]|nr:hypothetical protein [Chthonomonadaceae bacterium]
MKTQISPAAAAGIIALVVILVGFALWHSFAGPPPGDSSKIPPGFPGSMHKTIAPGQLPPGVAPAGGAPGTSPNGQPENGQPGTGG